MQKQSKTKFLSCIKKKIKKKKKKKKQSKNKSVALIAPKKKKIMSLSDKYIAHQTTQNCTFMPNYYLENGINTSYIYIYTHTRTHIYRAKIQRKFN